MNRRRERAKPKLTRFMKSNEGCCSKLVVQDLRAFKSRESGMASRHEALREAIGAFDVKIRSLSDLGIDYRRNERVLVKRRPPLRP